MNFVDVCRTCLTTDNLHPIFVGSLNDTVDLNPIFVGSVNDKRYSAAVFATTGIKVGINDGLPQQMCARCISFSNASLKFRKQCRDIETRLLQLQIECDGAAETLNSGVVSSENFDDKDVELKDEGEEEDNGIDDGDEASTSEADNALFLNPGVLDKDKEPLQLQPAGGAGAAPARSPARPRERPRCSTSPPQQLQLSSCFVRLERFPIEDLHHNLHTCGTCPMTFDCESSFRNHSCANSVEESNLNKVRDETAKKYLKCDICDKEYFKKRHIIRHLAGHNVKQVSEKLPQHSSNDAKFVNTEEISYSDNVSERGFGNQSVLTTHTGEWLKPHTCDVCSKEYSRKQHLIRHIQKLHKDGKVFVKKRHIIRHLAVHYAKKDEGKMSPYPSDGTNFANSDIKIYSANVSETRLRHQSVLTIHTGERPRRYICDMCAKEFPQKQLLIRHIRKLHRDDIDKKIHKHICDICKKRCRSLSKLAGHMRVHTREKPFPCDVCKKQFTAKSNLTRHRLIHTGAKPYCCRVCKKQFNQTSILAGHMRTHTGLKLYSCEICHKRFARATHLTRHSLVHSGEKQFSCDFCEQKFAHKHSLVNHWLRVHKGSR